VKEWQFNVLFWVGVGGAVFLLIGPEFGLAVGQNAPAVGGIGAILTYVLTQRTSITKKNGEKKDKPKDETIDRGGGG
jgi:hypothetical protein